LKWKFKTGDVVHGSPAISDGNLYAEAGTAISMLWMPAAGKEMWRFKTGEDPDIHNRSASVSAAGADRVVYFGCRDSKFTPWMRTGKERWSFSNKGSWVISSPATVDGKVYFATSRYGLASMLSMPSPASAFFPLTSSIGRCSLRRRLPRETCTLARIRAGSTPSTSRHKKVA